MVELTRGNLLEADVEALVNTVNCVGYMGKGIALQFKQAYPANFKVYESAARHEEVRPGRMLVVPTNQLAGPRYIINFPTKRHWRGESRLEDIDAGLSALIKEVARLGIHSVAVPPLGCGNGMLDWNVVRPRIIKAFETLPDVRVLLFEPVGAPEAREMRVRTARPEMTPARALLVKLMDRYRSMAYRLTLLEIQKLAYFLQEAGEPLRLKFESGHYGPYAANLNKVLERIEGHFTRGYGDSQKPDVEVALLPGAVQEADAFLAPFPERQARLDRVVELIEGFETPYGMELLSSAHWVVRHEGSSSDAGAVVAAVHGWNERKQKMFKDTHIRVASTRLSDLGWLE